MFAQAIKDDAKQQARKAMLAAIPEANSAASPSIGMRSPLKSR